MCSQGDCCLKVTVVTSLLLWLWKLMLLKLCNIHGEEACQHPICTLETLCWDKAGIKVLTLQDVVCEHQCNDMHPWPTLEICSCQAARSGREFQAAFRQIGSAGYTDLSVPRAITAQVSGSGVNTHLEVGWGSPWSHPGTKETPRMECGDAQRLSLACSCSRARKHGWIWWDALLLEVSSLCSWFVPLSSCFSAGKIPTSCFPGLPHLAIS